MASQNLFGPWLTDEIAKAILSFEPVCPECGLKAQYIHIFTETVHELVREIDASPTIENDKERLLIYVQKDYTYKDMQHPKERDYVQLECSTGHKWVETHLQFRDWRLELR